MGKTTPIKVTIIGDSRDGEKTVKSFGGTVEGLGSKMKGFGLAIGAAFAAAGVAAVRFGAKAVSSAADLNESVSKNNAVFQDQADEIEKWASTAATSFGQSKKQAIDAAAGFGNLFVQLGIGRGEAAKMSTQMVELASDFASFHNADPTEVIEAQTAAFRGEYDALQRFVPTINAAAVEQEALAMTGKSLTKELTLQEKAIATQSLMMKGAGDAMGDFDDTSDQLANRQRILKAQFEDTTAQLGTALLPAATVVAGFLANNLPAAIAAAGAAFNWLKANVIEPVRAAFERYRPMLAAFAEDFRAKFEQVRGWVTSIMPQVQEAVRHTLTVIQTLWRLVGDDIVRFASNAFRTVAAVIGGAMQAIRGVIQTVLAVINGDWGRAWDGLKQIVGGAWNAMFGIVRGAINGLRAIVGGIASVIGAAVGSLGGLLVDAGRSVIDGLIRGIRDRIRAVTDTVRSIASTVSNAFKGALGISSPSKVFAGYGRNVAEGLALGIRGGSGLAASAAGSLLNGVGPGTVGGVGPASNTRNINVNVSGVIQGPIDPAAITAAIRYSEALYA